MLGKILIPLGVVAAAAGIIFGVAKIKQEHDDREQINNDLSEENNGCESKRTYSDKREIQKNIERIKWQLANSEPGTPEYEKLSGELKEAYEILKKYKESRFFIEPKTIAILAVIGLIGFFAICLSQEDPSAIKIAQFVIKLFRI